ncbi:MFS general substrate transporter [Ascoidea rubescens DSM 1968]|uniref:MFS general substrate transporter n=1 Tax=Ascoidea rubescens DSM 1968 TaxID=1344418 RepID=A0A1D2VDD8_9ASCO|nr:MFS general substrate transporter [Ascoidea rubescens DSM 1968]ODV59714.1 MFS general substrate transporter [Ascoidea rubescens DSM 1968]
MPKQTQMQASSSSADIHAFIVDENALLNNSANAALNDNYKRTNTTDDYDLPNDSHYEYQNLLSTSNLSPNLNDLENNQLKSMINPQRSTIYIIILTVILGALQLSWCTEFAEGTPFLLSLGISKKVLSLIWIAGPLSGTIGQPIVGILSDNSAFSIGKRRPFIILGSILTSLSLVYLSNSVDIIRLFLPNDSSIDYIHRKTIPFASFGIYLLDFSIQFIQATSRALIIDNIPINQQNLANAYAARMIGSFNIFGYYLSSIELKKIYPLNLISNNQFKLLSFCSIFILSLFTIVVTILIKEQNPKNDFLHNSNTNATTTTTTTTNNNNNNNNNSVSSQFKNFFKKLYLTIKFKLSPQIKLINFVEFFAWIGYFPMLFYTTTYVGEIYIFQYLNQRKNDGLPPLLDNSALSQLKEESVRKGSQALLVHSVSSLFIVIFLPLLVNSNLFNFNTIHTNILSFSFIKSPTVKNFWIISHIIFIICMSSTFFIQNFYQIIIMYCFLGIPWGSALWAPFVLIGEELTRIKHYKTSLKQFILNNNNNDINDILNDQSTSYSSNYDNDNDNDNDNEIININTNINTNTNANINIQTNYSNKVFNFKKYEHEAGIILGIHNIFVAAPQAISSLLSSILFSFLADDNNNNINKTYKKYYDDDGNVKFDSSLSWIFRFGGLTCLIALLLSLKLKNDEQLDEEYDDCLKIEMSSKSKTNTN